MSRGLTALSLLAAMSVLPLVGCSFTRPEARATSARLVESRDGTSRIEIELELLNPGKDEVELLEYDYTLALADGARYGGKWAALRTLPPKTPVRATIPAIVPTASATGAASWSVSGSLRYRDPQSVARILYEAGILRPEASFAGSGGAVGAAAPSVEAPAGP
jgi:hypothetical protein